MEDSEEKHVVHILARHHFTNSIRKISRTTEAKKYLAQLDGGADLGEARLPEMIIVSFAGLDLAEVLGAARRGTLVQVPLVALAGSRDDEDFIRSQDFPNVHGLARPLGFFKLLEAMQKLGMYWTVLRSPVPPQ